MMLAVYLCILGSLCVSGEIVTPRPGSLKMGQPPVLLHRAALYSAADAPSNSKPGNGKPYIKITATFRSAKPGGDDLFVPEDSKVVPSTGPPVTGRVQVFVVRGPDYDVLGNCDSDRERIIKPSSRHSVWHVNVDFLDASYTELSGSGLFVPEQTGIHWLLLSNCDGKLGNVTYDSVRSEWMNPFGYLPGSLYAFQVFYRWLSVSFGVLWLVWMVLLLYHWNEVIELQHWTTGLVFLNLVESLVWFLDYTNFNEVGTRHTTVLVLAMLLTVLRRAISRMLVTAVCLGYGVLKPSLGQDGQILAVLGVLYFVFEAVMELLLKYSQTHDVSKFIKAVFVVPPSFLDAVFYWWIFLSLARNIQSLKRRRQNIKLELYWNFALVLLASLLVAIGLALYQMYYFSKDLDLYDWQELWAMEVGYNELVAGGILCSVLWLWRPSNNSQRYSYSALPIEEVELANDTSERKERAPRAEPVRIDLTDQKQVLTTKKSTARFALADDDDDDDDDDIELPPPSGTPQISQHSRTPMLFNGKGDSLSNGKQT